MSTLCEGVLGQEDPILTPHPRAKVQLTLILKLESQHQNLSKGRFTPYCTYSFSLGSKFKSKDKLTPHMASLQFLVWIVKLFNSYYYLGLKQ